MEYTLLIKQIRTQQGLTQSELAKKAQIKQSYISQLESNNPRVKSPTLRVMFKIAKALNVCPHILVRYQTNCVHNCVNFCS